MKRLLLFLLALPLLAQQKQPVTSLQEDCGVTFSFTTASSGAQASGTVQAGSTGTTAVIDNRTVGCLDWVVTYSTTSNVTGLSLDFQTAINVAGNPGTWSDYGGTLSAGINPNTAATTPWATTTATGTQYNFLRMNLTSLTGAGTVYGTLKGWKQRPPSGGGSGGTGCPNPCPVEGVDAVGSPATVPPVTVSGQGVSSGSVRRLTLTEQGSILQPSTTFSPLADGMTNDPPVLELLDFTGNPQAQTNVIYPYIFNGATWDRQFVCTNHATASLTNATVTSIIAASGSTQIRVCNAHATTDGSAENFVLTQGTGGTCAGGTSNNPDKFLNVLGFAMDYNASYGPLILLAGNALCVNQSGTTQNAFVYVSYAQY